MTIYVVMPQMGESIAEGTIARWLKHVGDAVDRDEPLFEISTDKVDAEIPSPAAGVLVAIHVVEGGTAAVNSVVAVIRTEAAAGPAKAGPHEDKAGPRKRHRTSPVASRIARLHQIDLQCVTGSGSRGRVLKGDVLRHLGGDRTSASRVPMTVMRRKIAEHMVTSRRISAHAHSVFEVNCSRIEQVRKARKAQFEAAGAKVSVMPFVIHAAALALRDFPLLNASLDGDSVIYHMDINVGVAVALENGLIVPVVTHADRLSLMDLSLTVADLARRARSKELKPEEVAGGTFTVTNPGNYGGTFATPIINQPQVAILELGTVETRVVVAHDAVAVRPMMYLTLGFDHRLIEGAVADRFLSTVKKTLETWSDS